MSREVRFTVTEDEYATLVEYVAAKRRWRRVSDFLRDACFQTIERYPARIRPGASGKAGAPIDPDTPRKPVGGTAHADAGAFCDTGGLSSEDCERAMEKNRCPGNTEER